MKREVKEARVGYLRILQKSSQLRREARKLNNDRSEIDNVDCPDRSKCVSINLDRSRRSRHVQICLSKSRQIQTAPDSSEQRQVHRTDMLREIDTNRSRIDVDVWTSLDWTCLDSFGQVSTGLNRSRHVWADLDNGHIYTTLDRLG